MEKMAAIRAAQKNPTQDTSPSKSSLADVDADPFVVRMPVYLTTQPSEAPIATAPHPRATDTDNGQQDKWPQVGEPISISASPSYSSITDDGAKSVNVNGSSPRKSLFPLLSSYNWHSKPVKYRPKNKMGLCS
jgi:hypothetical protein